MLVRSRGDRVVAGIAAGLGHHLGVDPVLVRIAFVVLTLAGGVGVVLYGLAWVLLPEEQESAATRPPRPATVQQAVALGLILLGVLLLLRDVGLWLGDPLVWPLLLAAAGSAVVWIRADDDERRRWTGVANRWQGGPVGVAGPLSPVRIIVGAVLIAAAVAGFLAANDALSALRDLALAVLAALVGAVLLFGPWLWRLIGQLGSERRERIRQEERAELAAHLHDSVLQTLALIQRSSDQPRRMVTLARRQERELRTWLYGPGGPGPAQTLTTAVSAVTEEVEALHDVAFETVTVGDVPVDDAVRGLLAALREACTNVAKHAETASADVYVEVEDDAVVAYVRDRGAGFRPGEVAPDRHGIRRSMVERLARHGGSAEIFSSPGEGTEVELRLPLQRRTARAGDAPPDAALPRDETSSLQRDETSRRAGA